MYFGISELGHWANNKVAASKALSMLTPKFLSSWDLKVPCASNISCLLTISIYYKSKEKVTSISKMITKQKNAFIMSAVLCLVSAIWFLVSSVFHVVFCSICCLVFSAFCSTVCCLVSVFFFCLPRSGVQCLPSIIFCLLLYCLVPGIFCLSCSVFCFTVCCLVISVFHVLSSVLVSSVFCLSFSVFCSTVCCLVISVFHVLSSALRFGVWCLVSSVYHALSFDLASSV